VRSTFERARPRSLPADHRRAMRGPVDAQPCETRCGHAIAACPSTTGQRAPREAPGSPGPAWSAKQRPMRLPTGAPTTSPPARPPRSPADLSSQHRAWSRQTTTPHHASSDTAPATPPAQASEHDSWQPPRSNPSHTVTHPTAPAPPSPATPTPSSTPDPDEAPDPSPHPHSRPHHHPRPWPVCAPATPHTKDRTLTTRTTPRGGRVVSVLSTAKSQRRRGRRRAQVFPHAKHFSPHFGPHQQAASRPRPAP